MDADRDPVPNKNPIVVYELLYIVFWQEKFTDIRIYFCDYVVALQRFCRASYTFTTFRWRRRSGGLRMYKHKDLVIHIYMN